MTHYAFVEQGSVQAEYSQLPVNWKNISNFYALANNPQQLAVLGWYELQDSTVPITNDLLQYHGPVEYQIDPDNGMVYKSQPIMLYDPPPSPNQLHDQQTQSFMQALRQERNIRLQLTDWTQMADVQGMRDDAWKQAWASYRQSLRDLPQMYSNAEYIMWDINQVIWPEPPGDI